MRPTEAVIDLGAIRRNLARLAANAAPAVVCAVTKADGYGHGAVACTQAALEAGAAWVAVALVEEGIELRTAGVEAPILLLSEPRAHEMGDVVAAGLTPTVYTAEGIAAIGAAAEQASAAPYRVHLNVDTGMHRVGVHPDSAAERIKAIDEQPHLQLGGIWTHFAVADEPQRQETATQLARFVDVLDNVAEYLDDEVIVHASNSAGSLVVADARFDMVRVGISLYGIEPAPGVGSDVGLEPAMSIETELSFVKSVRAGDSISYGLRHTFDHDTVVGTIPIGYADGLRRDSFVRGVPVLVGGIRRPIVGVVTMDQTMIDLGSDSAAQVGDPVVLVGEQGDASLQVDEIAELLDTIAYEVVCDVGRRVRRRYT